MLLTLRCKDTVQNGKGAWQEWLEIGDQKGFRLMPAGNNSCNELFAELILGGPFNERALAVLACSSEKNVKNSKLYA